MLNGSHMWTRPEALSCPLKLTVLKCKNDLWSDKSKFDIKNTSKTTTNSSAAGNLYQARMVPNSNTNTPKTHNLDAQTSSNCFEKKRRCYTMWHDSVPTILRPVAGLKFEMSWFCAWNWNKSQFKQLLYYLGSNVNIVSCDFWNSFSFHFIQIEKNFPTFTEFESYIAGFFY